MKINIFILIDNIIYEYGKKKQKGHPVLWDGLQNF